MAVACQIAATRFRIPSIVLLLPAGFVAGTVTSTVNPNKLFGSAYPPMVGLAVAIILFEGGLDLDFRELEGRSQRVVRRLLILGIPITWVGASLFASLLLGISARAAVMLGCILIVSGPTVLAPILDLVKPGRQLRSILWWEGTMIDPIGAILAVLAFEAIRSGISVHPGMEILRFLAKIGIGVVGGAVGTAVLWVLIRKLKLSGVMATQATVATVVLVAAVCNAFREDTGLVAAITMGVALANLPGMDKPEDRPFFKTIVQLVTGLLFVSISATITPSSLRGLVWPTTVLAICLIVAVRPLVALGSTVRSNLSVRERAFVGFMDPRGIVAASTAATFSAPLIAVGLPGAGKLLPATFLVIMLTVMVYGLAAPPAARFLQVTHDDHSR